MTCYGQVKPDAAQASWWAMCSLLAGEGVFGAGGQWGATACILMGSSGRGDGLEDRTHPKMCMGHLTILPAASDQPQTLFTSSLETMPGCEWKRRSWCLPMLSIHQLHKTSVTPLCSQKCWELALRCPGERKQHIIIISAHFSLQKQSFQEQIARLHLSAALQSSRTPVSFLALSPSEENLLQIQSLGRRAVCGNRVKP